MWMRSIFRYYCKKNNCTVIRTDRSHFEPEGKAEDRAQAVFEFERALAMLLIRIVDARAQNPHRNTNRLDNQVIRDFAKELWDV
jgi:hypothetical protein